MYWIFYNNLRLLNGRSLVPLDLHLASFCFVAGAEVSLGVALADAEVKVDPAGKYFVFAIMQ